MTLEETYAKALEEARDPMRQSAKIIELEAKNRDLATLLEQQQKEISALWKRLGATADTIPQVMPGDSAPEQAPTSAVGKEEDYELELVERELAAFDARGDAAGKRGFLRAWKRETEKRAAREASRDPLTGLPNRRTFMDDARKILNLVRELPEYNAYLQANPDAQRREEAPLDEGEFSVIMLDLDHFKNINDSYGHAAGDAVLKTVAEALRKNLRPTDEIARWGGEEFIVAFKSRRRGARVGVAEKIRRIVENTQIVYDGKRIPVTASVGAAKWNLGEDMNDVIQSADQQLYKAKNAGRNRTSIDSVV